jgi:hypothetical protein
VEVEPENEEENKSKKVVSCIFPHLVFRFYLAAVCFT